MDGIMYLICAVLVLSGVAGLEYTIGQCFRAMFGKEKK